MINRFLYEEGSPANQFYKKCLADMRSEATQREREGGTEADTEDADGEYCLVYIWMWTGSSLSSELFTDQSVMKRWFSCLASRCLFISSLHGAICIFNFLLCDAMHSADYAVTGCLSVHPSVTCQYSLEMGKYIIKLFTPSGSHAILLFPYQTVWQYSDGDPANGATECKGGMKKIANYGHWKWRRSVDHMWLFIGRLL